MRLQASDFCSYLYSCEKAAQDCFASSAPSAGACGAGCSPCAGCCAAGTALQPRCSPQPVRQSSAAWRHENSRLQVKAYELPANVSEKSREIHPGPLLLPYMAGFAAGHHTRRFALVPYVKLPPTACPQHRAFSNMSTERQKCCEQPNCTIITYGLCL